MTGIGNTFCQTPKLSDQAEVQKFFNPDSGLWVINSWATYCKPCLEEMPHFIKADSAFSQMGVRFVFLSFDFAEDTARVAGIIKKYGIPGEHYLVNETDMNSVINSLDSSWSGGLPATWFISPVYRRPVYYGFRQFYDMKEEIELLISSSYEEN